jgi:Protein of unknown function (DUF3489)
MSSVPNLTDIQQQILSAASLRDDRCLVLPKTLKGGAAQKVATKLLTIGFVREIKAKAECPVWRRDAQLDQTYSLKVTAAGLKAIFADKDEGPPPAITKTSLGKIKDAPKDAQPEALPGDAGAALALPPPIVRQGTKIAQVLDLLQRNSGASLDELTSVTGWLPHTARAALTGLRHRGFEVRLERGAAGVASVYRATTAPIAIAL